MHKRHSISSGTGNVSYRLYVSWLHHVGVIINDITSAYSVSRICIHQLINTRIMELMCGLCSTQSYTILGTNLG
jgi:hypothetical protein